MLAAFPAHVRSLLAFTPGELEAPMRHVWASVGHRAPREYRRRAEPDDAEPATAVIVMDMVDVEAAGVLFTCGPVGAVADLRAGLVSGTAERLVGGEQDPIDLVVSRRSAATAAEARLGPAMGRSEVTLSPPPSGATGD